MKEFFSEVVRSIGDVVKIFASEAINYYSGLKNKKD